MSNIINSKAMTYSDASVDAGMMVGFWIITDIEHQAKMKYMIFLKEQSKKSPINTEAMVLLDLVEIVCRKLKQIQNSSLAIFNDNRKLVGTMNCNDLTKNQHVQNARAEIVGIRQICDKAIIKFEIILISEYLSITKLY